VERLEILR